MNLIDRLLQTAQAEAFAQYWSRIPLSGEIYEELEEVPSLSDIFDGSSEEETRKLDSRWLGYQEIEEELEG